MRLFIACTVPKMFRGIDMNDTKISHWFLLDLTFIILTPILYLIKQLWGIDYITISAFAIVAIVFSVASLIPGIPSGIQTFCRYTIIKVIVLATLIGTYGVLIK